MVDPVEFRSPAYTLDHIRAAAKLCRFRYDGRKVNGDIRNLGYTQTDVARCIAGLSAGDFRKSLAYSNKSLRCLHQSLSIFRRREAWWDLYEIAATG